VELCGGNYKLTGKYLHSIDNKGRLIVPSPLRRELGEVCYVTVSYDKCLSVYSQENWDAFQERINALPLTKSRSLRVVFANTATCELDSQGRILIPQELRDFAAIDKNVTIIGFANHAEIWDRDAYIDLEKKELNSETIAAAMEELGI
jgi:MraZ protein